MTQHTEGRTGAGTADLPGFDMEDFRQLMERLEMKSSARNQFHGTVLAIASGPVNAEVTLDIGGGNRLVAMITQGSVERLGLSPGNAAYSLVKATSILLTAAMKEIVTAFEAATGYKVLASYGSTGKLYAQIVNGAPFGLFLAADAARPKRLEEEGKAVPSGPRGHRSLRLRHRIGYPPPVTPAREHDHGTRTHSADPAARHRDHGRAPVGGHPAGLVAGPYPPLAAPPPGSTGVAAPGAAAHGARLLPAGGSGSQRTARGARRGAGVGQPRLHLSGPGDRFLRLLPAVRGAADPERLRGPGPTPAGGGRHPAGRPPGPFFSRGATPVQAGLPDRGHPRFRPHRGGVRRGADDRRQRAGSGARRPPYGYKGAEG